MKPYGRALAAVALSLFTLATSAADWPAYRRDFARSGVTPDKLTAPLHRQWTYVPAHRPMPAWPEPSRELNRVDFDYAPQVVVAQGLAYFGSSADCKVYAIDLVTGRPRWSFSTGGPIRFAPAIEAGRLFVASDDGVLYCLDAATGKLLWRFHTGPRKERIFGNGRLISRWPLRSGVAVEDGTVYLSAGMWPSEGVYVYALRAEDGTVVWENGTSGTLYVKQPHPGSFAMTGVAPQGTILGHKGQIFVPTGRNVAAAFDRRTGKLQYYRSAPTGWGNRWGGCWNVLAQGYLIGWKTHVGPDFNSQLGEYAPDPRDGLVVFDARTGKELREVNGPLRAVVRDDTIYTAGAGAARATDLSAWVKGKAEPKWETPYDRAYEMIVAGHTLILGGDGRVSALSDTTGKALWEDKVSGQVRGLAVADGRLLASTTEGTILCYGPKPVAEPATVQAGAGSPPYANETAGSPAAKLAKQIIDETGKSAGVCVALGAGDGRLLYQLARQSELMILCAEPDETKATAVRKGLGAAGLYGVRVVILPGGSDKLEFPDFCADLVLAGHSAPIDVTACSARELYRVLRPCGGLLSVAAPGAPSSTVRKWLAAAGVPDGDIRSTARGADVVRGPLPGADNWTHQYASPGRAGASNDDRARLPMKMLWFGEPGPARLVSRHWGGPAPLCVDGRMFAIGQYSITAVDAYNGRGLWLRDFGSQEVGWHPVRQRGSAVAADSGSLYVALGRQCLRLDAATGETVQTYELPPAPASIPAREAQSLIWSWLAVTEERIVGAIGGRAEGRALFAYSKDGRLLWTHGLRGAAGNNALSVDNRRVYLVDANSKGEVDRASKRGRKVEAFSAIIALDAGTGQEAWRQTKGAGGGKALWLAEGVLLATSSGYMTGCDAQTGAVLYEQPARVRRFPVIAGSTIYIEPVAYDLHTGARKQRANPFTGDKVPWFYQRSYGCGSISGGTHVLMFRSGTLGVYDLAGDSGVHNVGGVRAGCYVNAIAAGGLVLAPPSDAGCTCSYSLRTTVALAPSSTQRDWSIFYDQLPRSAVSQAAFNLGAPGDRRDGASTVWLAMPRPETRNRRASIATPFRFTFAPGFGPYRRSAESVRIADTHRPWLYASGLRGVSRAELDLAIMDRGYTSWPCAAKPNTDGRLDEPCWDGYRSVQVAREGAAVTLRHDDQNLHLAYTRPARADAAWKAATSGQDGPVWKDDSFEVYLSPAPRSTKNPAKKCLHLGVSASGARYDAAWTYVTPTLPECRIPRVQVAIDGNPDDWADQGLQVRSLTGIMRNEPGKMKRAKDFNPAFQIGWSTEGLLMLIKVTDNVVHEWESQSKLTVGDCVQLLLAPAAGAAPTYECVITPGPAPGFAGRLTLQDSRKEPGRAPLTGKAAGGKTADGYFVEVLLPWSNLGITPALGTRFAMQLFANDDDMSGSRARFRVLWHPAGDPRRDPLAYQTFELADEASPAIDFRPNAKPWRWGLSSAVPPYPFPVRLPSLGAQREDKAFDAQWSGKAHADGNAFTAEIAVPWTTLAAMGLNRTQLMLDVANRGPLARAPKLQQGFERLILVPGDAGKPKQLGLRLHFAEIDDVRPGERVFDVKVQGKTVLNDLDVAKAAGGSHRALVKEIKGIDATRAVTLEFIPKAKALTDRTAPIISAIEIVKP